MVDLLLFKSTSQKSLKCFDFETNKIIYSWSTMTKKLLKWTVGLQVNSLDQQIVIISAADIGKAFDFIEYSLILQLLDILSW